MPTRGIRTRSTSRIGAGSTYQAPRIAAVSAARRVHVPFLLTRVLTAAVALAAIALFPTPTSCPDVCHPSANPLLLALSIGAVYHARRGEWLLAGALGVLAALTRAFVGAAVALPIAIEAFRRIGARGALATATWAPAAFIAWLAVLWRMTGDQKALFTAEANWGTRPAVALQAFADLFDPSMYGFPYFVLALTVLIGALVIVAWRILRPSLAAYATVVFLISIATGSLTSAPRYYLTIFPAFVVLALVAHPWVGRTYVALGTTIGVIFTAMYSLWYWVA